MALDLEPGVPAWEPHTSPFLHWKGSGFSRKRQCIFLCARGGMTISPPGIPQNENYFRNHECWHRRASSSTLLWSWYVWNVFLFTECYNTLTLTELVVGLEKAWEKGEEITWIWQSENLSSVSGTKERKAFSHCAFFNSQAFIQGLNCHLVVKEIFL